jgi:hypothetical protein
MLTLLWDTPIEESWPFDDLLAEFRSTADATPQRPDLLQELQQGRNVEI